MKAKSRVTISNKVAFDQRISKINANRDTRTVWECVDKPIRPLVFELARVGMIPKFSCCGYTYYDEEEPKTHHGSMAYVHLYAPAGREEILDHLFNMAQKSGWEYHIFNKFIWSFKCGNPVPDDMYQKTDGIEESIHQYEGYGLKIERFATLIQEYLPTYKDPVTIHDGNYYYINRPTWMVLPKQDFVIGVEEYYGLYGRLDADSCLKTTEEDWVGQELITVDKFNSWVKMQEEPEKNTKVKEGVKE